MRKPCSVGGCERESRALGWCTAHRYRVKKYGHPGPAAIKNIPPKDLHGGDVLDWRGWDVSDLGCWVVRGTKNPDGYGQLKVWGEGRGAHRVAYEHWVGPIPDGLIIRHKCDNPPCINPDHLEPGSHVDNSRDRVERGRSRVSKGERNPQAKLTENEVRDIRKLYEDGLTQAELTRRFGMSQTAIYAIVHRVNWKHLE